MTFLSVKTLWCSDRPLKFPTLSSVSASYEWMRNYSYLALFTLLDIFIITPDKEEEIHHPYFSTQNFHWDSWDLFGSSRPHSSKSPGQNPKVSGEFPMTGLINFHIVSLQDRIGVRECECNGCCLHSDHCASHLNHLPFVYMLLSYCTLQLLFNSLNSPQSLVGMKHNTNKEN